MGAFLVSHCLGGSYGKLYQRRHLRIMLRLKMRYQSYIAPLNDPGFHWDEIPDEVFRSGNTPKVKLVPSKSYDYLPYAPYFITNNIEEGKFVGQQIDWGAWGMIVKKADSLRLWQDQEPKSETRRDRWEGILADIEALDDGEQYVLVVCEMP